MATFTQFVRRSARAFKVERPEVEGILSEKDNRIADVVEHFITLKNDADTRLIELFSPRGWMTQLVPSNLVSSGFTPGPELDSGAFRLTGVGG